MDSSTDTPLSAGAAGSLADTATGRELDALVAEHVMGWRWMELNRSWTHSCIGLFPSADSDLMNPGDWRDVTNEPVKAVRARGWSRNLPSYSTDHNDAALVLERMRERRLFVQIDASTDGFWHVLFIHRPRYDGKIVGAATSSVLPATICRAALKSVENEQVNNQTVRTAAGEKEQNQH